MPDDRPDIRLSRKERERERTRRDILDAALQVFGQAGYHQACMEDVAREAGFSTGALYNYFRNKEDIFVSLVRRVFGELESQFTSALEKPGSFHDGLQQFLDTVAEFSEHNIVAFRFMMAAEAQPPVASEQLHKDMIGGFFRMIDALSGLMERGIDEGALREQDPNIAAHAMMALLGHFLRGWVMSQAEDPPRPVQEFMEMVRTHFLYGAAVPIEDK